MNVRKVADTPHIVDGTNLLEALNIGKAKIYPTSLLLFKVKFFGIMW